MSKKLTRWFPSHVKPVRKGVYIGSLFKDASVFRYWNGRTWSFPSVTPRGAFILRHSVSEVSHEIEWRGLAKEPK